MLRRFEYTSEVVAVYSLEFGGERSGSSFGRVVDGEDIDGLQYIFFFEG